MSNPTSDDLIKLGYRVVMNGELAQLREKVGMSRNAQANLIEVVSNSLARWEALERSMNIETAQRIGEWFWGAQQALKAAPGLDFDLLICGAKAAQSLHVPIEDLDEIIAERKLRHEKLGVLGTFIYATELSA
jgi:DNA-binding XRE family transcriptional regulator